MGIRKTCRYVDIDIFVKFNKKTSEKDFRNIGTEIGFESLKKYKPYTRHAEHPFVEAMIDGTRVNIVPCYDVNTRENGKAQQTDPYIIQNSCHKNYLSSYEREM